MPAALRSLASAHQRFVNGCWLIVAGMRHAARTTFAAAHDRRRFGRRSVRVHGWAHPSRHVRIPCVMTEFSRGGATITLPEGTHLPGRFQLSFDALDEPLDCEIRHGHDGVFGVEFLASLPEQGAALDRLVALLAV